MFTIILPIISMIKTVIVMIKKLLKIKKMLKNNIYDHMYACRAYLSMCDVQRNRITVTITIRHHALFIY